MMNSKERDTFFTSTNAPAQPLPELSLEAMMKAIEELKASQSVVVAPMSVVESKFLPANCFVMENDTQYAIGSTETGKVTILPKPNLFEPMQIRLQDETI